MLRIVQTDIVFQEFPDEISLALTFSSCPLACKGCHSKHTWNKDLGAPCTVDFLEKQIQRYQSLISCVLFLGGV